jgi:hypothetical protein
VAGAEDDINAARHADQATRAALWSLYDINAARTQNSAG